MTGTRAAEWSNLYRDRRGAVMVEFLIAVIWVFSFYLCVWQLAQLYIADLLVKEAAFVAARTAVVVLPDDPARYNNNPVNDMNGNGKGDRKYVILQAAATVLRASRSFVGLDVTAAGIPADPTDPTAVNQMLTVTVRAQFACTIPIGHVICGNNPKVIAHSAQLPYHGAIFKYSAPAGTGAATQVAPTTINQFFQAIH